jgi:catechol 2,3-dioxygenase-like lactoylglutathione lyase family enzyme
MMADVGLTHVALLCHDLDESVAFYASYARMRIVHQRQDPGGARVAWISDQTRPFVIVLIEAPGWLPRIVLRAIRRVGTLVGHLGVGCESAAEVDRLAAQARAAGRLRLGPKRMPPPVGYFALLTDPDGYVLELSHGQEVGLTVGGPSPEE